MFENIDKFPSELYLEEVLARKKARGRPVLLVRRKLAGGWFELWAGGRNQVKANRKALVMAWQEARALAAVPPSNSGQRQLAASVLAALQLVLPGHYNAARMIYSHAEYAEALHFYRGNLKPRRELWQKIP